MAQACRGKFMALAMESKIAMDVSPTQHCIVEPSHNASVDKMGKTARGMISLFL